MERQIERNKEKYAADVSQLQQDCDRLQAKLDSLQSENNLLTVCSQILFSEFTDHSGTVNIEWIEKNLKWKLWH